MYKKNSPIIICLMSLFFPHTSIKNVSVVYNLRIAETTKRQKLQEQYKKPSIIALTFLNQMRTRYSGTKENVFGGLGTYLYSPHSVYARVDFAAGQVRAKNKIGCFSRTQTDDILFSSGYGHKINEQTRITFSGLLGIPTHNDFIAQALQLGTGHVGLGAQIDSAWNYSPAHSLMGAARLIHFFPRTIEIPIAAQKKYFNFGLGNLADLLIAHTSQWKTNQIEFGYNATFAFGAYIHPTIQQITDQSSFIRNSFYANYKHFFLIKQFPSAITGGISYGFDHPKIAPALKRIITVWITWGINF